MDTNVRHTNYGKITPPLKAPTVYKQTDEALICLTKKKVQLPLRTDSTWPLHVGFVIGDL